MTAPSQPLAGLAPPPERAPSILSLLLHPPSNMFQAFPRDAYEQPVFRPRRFPHLLAVVSDPDAVRRVMLDEVADFPRHPQSDEIFSACFGEGLLGVTGETWRRHRRILAPYFGPRSVAALAPVMTEAAGLWAERWAALPRGAKVDMAAEMKGVSLKIVSDTMFSSDAAELTELADGALSATQDGLKLGLPDALPLIGTLIRRRKYAWVRREFARFNAAVTGMIGERERDLTSAPPDLLTRLIAARDSEDGGGLTAQEVRDEVVTLFEAGHETVATALTWTWYLLAHHPAEEARLHAELDAVLGGRLPTADDVAALPYTRMVIEEAMRLFPPVPTIAARTPRTACEICGVPVRAGQRVFVSPWIIHRHRRLWDQPERFDPERFLPARSAGRPRFAYLPFGAGPRVCIGAGFAMMEATLVLAALAQRFRPRLVAGRPVRLRAQLTLAPIGGLAMVVEPR
ncbi:MAG: cytochrome P450 [Rhodospirillaceae bacterium]|nr:cytochrome P450 [Rhodospirillaceae bacterium]